MARIEKSVEVNVPVSVAYRQMTQFEEFPRFMEDVQEVRRIDDTHLHWRTRSDGREHEWDSEITAQERDKCIVWRNLNGHANTGRVEFAALGPDRTKVTLSMEIRPQGTPAQVQLVDNLASLHAEQNLARFKKLVETGAGEPWRAGTQAAGAATGTGWSAGMHGGGASERAGRASGGGHAAYGAAGHAAYRGGGPGSWLPRAAGMLEDPFATMRKVGEEMNHLIGRFIGRPFDMPPWAQQGGRHWSPPVEVAQRGDAVVICADLPGIRCEDVQIEVRRDRLTIAGERHAQLQPERHARHGERPHGHFYREIPLPEGVDPDAASASMHDGVLEVTVPVLPEKQRGRRLDIKTGR